MKRIFDLIFAFSLLIIFCIPLAIVCFLIFIQDFKSPLYMAPRVAKNDGEFTMIKLRSMVHNADANKVDSTKKDDVRITFIGKVVRKLKFDELAQIINVLNGTMSFVGPRPQVRRDVNLYTNAEKEILHATPGITDFASIVFSDEGNILEGSDDPDLKYNQVIRPWKSRLAIFYIRNQSIILDLKLIFLTVYNFLNREKTLMIISSILSDLNASNSLVEVVKRKNALTPYPPPGSDDIVVSRNQI